MTKVRAQRFVLIPFRYDRQASGFTRMISSRQNQWYKRIREAVREHAGEIVVEGRKQIADALTAGWEPLVIVSRGETSGPAPGSRAPLAFAPALFDSVADTRTPQDFLALFERPSSTFAALLHRRDTIVVALDRVQDPGNVGTIVRLAAAFDCAGVALLPGCADPFGPKAIRASVGAILNVPVASITEEELLEAGLPLFATTASARAMPPPPRNAILVFGSEGTGVSEAVRRAATPLAISMSPRVESLNVAAAAAILLSRSWEAR